MNVEEKKEKPEEEEEKPESVEEGPVKEKPWWKFW